jgi:hypothetical protein
VDDIFFVCGEASGIMDGRGVNDEQGKFVPMNYVVGFE